MKYSKGDLVISTKKKIEWLGKHQPEFLLCEKGDRLKILKCFPKDGFPNHGVDSYSVQDEESVYGDFFMEETDLEQPVDNNDGPSEIKE